MEDISPLATTVREVNTHIDIINTKDANRLLRRQQKDF